MQIELDAVKMVFGGDALCKTADNQTVFVSCCIPGEKILAEITLSKKNYSLGKLIRIITPSLDRIIPRCKHFLECGGCSYQHLSYSFQTSLKEAVFQEQLTRLGKIRNPLISALIPSAQEWNYRSAMQFHIDAQGQIGLQHQRSHTIIPISECHLPTAGIVELLNALEFGEGHCIERLEIRESEDRTILLTMISSSPEIPEISCDLPVSIIHHHRGHSVVLAGENSVTYKILNQQFSVSAGSFFQVNLHQAERLVELLLQYLNGAEFSTIMDLYCGVGLFSKFLAPYCKRLIAIESSPSACEDFTYNLDNYEHCELYMGTVETILPHIKAEPELVILDPPRAGMEKKALVNLLHYLPRLMVYISCNPSSLARDLQPIFNAGYKIKKIVPLDMFPQTYHIESICFLEL